MMRSNHNNLRSRRGNAMVEFALSASVLIPLFLGLVARRRTETACSGSSREPTWQRRGFDETVPRFTCEGHRKDAVEVWFRPPARFVGFAEQGLFETTIPILARVPP